MGNLLFYAALVLLGMSVILYCAHHIMRERIDLDIFTHLLKDRNYPVQLIDEDILSKCPVEIDDFNYCWLSAVFRKMTENEISLLRHSIWMGRCGGFALFLSFALFPPIITILAAIVFAVIIVGIYRGMLSVLFVRKTFRRALKIYQEQHKN